MSGPDPGEVDAGDVLTAPRDPLYVLRSIDVVLVDEEVEGLKQARLAYEPLVSSDEEKRTYAQFAAALARLVIDARVEGPLDHLDHAPTRQFVGGKIGIDAAAKQEAAEDDAEMRHGPMGK